MLLPSKLLTHHTKYIDYFLGTGILLNLFKNYYFLKFVIFFITAAPPSSI